MKNYLKIILLSFLICSCAPRGENNSLDEVLNTQKTHFGAMSKQAQLNDAVKAPVNSLATSLEKLESATDASGVAGTSEAIAGDIFTLITKAGFTSRPALTELGNQYRQLSVNKDKVNLPAVKLLVARTYSALASELETTKFSL